MFHRKSPLLMGKSGKSTISTGPFGVLIGPWSLVFSFRIVSPSHQGGTDCPVAQGPDRLPAVEIPARRQRDQILMFSHG